MRLKTVLLLLLIITIFSCKRENTVDSEKSIFRYNEAAGIVNLDPAFARDQAHIWVCNQLFNGLVQTDDSLNIIPSIAQSWVVSDDGTEYIFNLRSDVYFHYDECFVNETRKVVADDFVYSFKRLLSKEIASPGSWTLSKIKLDKGNIPLVQALNDSTLKIVLEQSFPPFLGILSMQYCSVIPYEAVDFYKSEFGRHPIGSGPFYLKNWVEGIKLVMRKNDKYFEFENNKRLPYLDAVSVSFVIDKMTAFLELVKGNIDFISGLDASYKDELLSRDGKLKPKYQEHIRILSAPYLNTEYLGILVDDKGDLLSPLSQLKIRQAINYGFDRKKMIKFLRNNIGIPGEAGIIPAGMHAHGVDKNYGYSYDPDRSRALLKEIGYYELEEKPEIKLVTTSDYLDLCKYVQSQLGEFGLEINVEVSPAAAMREMKANSKISFFRASWIADYPDPENYLSLFVTDNFSPNGPNYTHYSNSKYDSLYKQAIKVIDNKKRYELYSQMDSVMMTESPVVILFYDESIRFIRKDIIGMTSNPINLLNLKSVNRKH